MINILRKYKYFLLLFLLFEILFLSLVTYDQKNEIQKFLDVQTASAKREYSSTYNSFQKAALIIDASIARRPEIIGLFKDAYHADENERAEIRSEMLYLLEDDFITLQKLHFKELHFFLPDNHSFLNMDEPGVFGDDLSDVHEDVVYVNSSHQAIEGFEIGRVSNSFCFVYPLFDDDRNYVGSLEISLTAEAFQEELEKSFDTHLHYIVNEDFLRSKLQPSVINLYYSKSMENNNFLSLNEHREMGKSIKNTFYKNVKSDITRHMKLFESFTLFADNGNNIMTATFLVIENGSIGQAVAYFILYKDDLRIHTLQKNYLLGKTLGSLLIFFILLFVVAQIHRKKELDRINERYELTLAGVGDGIWDWDLVTNKIFFSKRWKEMLGYAENEIGNSLDMWESRVHPDDIQRAYDEFKANIAGKTEYYENLHRLRHKDGRWIWIQDRGKTLFDAQGKAIRMLGTHTDVTEKKALEDRMAKNKASLAEAQKIAHLGNWEWNVSDRQIIWSDELFRLLGEEPQSFRPTYRSLMSYLPASEKERYRNILQNVINNKCQERDYVWFIIRRDSSRRYIHSTIKVVYTPEEELVRVSGTFLDITERIETEKKLSKMNKELHSSYEKQKIKTAEALEAKQALEISHTAMLAAKLEAEQSSCSKSEFLANMSHEIRTPLNAINGFISLLKDNETDVEKLEYLKIIDHSSETLLNIINDILDFSKIESGKLVIERANFIPKKELYGTAKLFQAKAAEKEITLDINCSENMPDVLHGDALRLKQILSNLLSNAIKFTPSRGEISCNIKYQDGHLSFRVKDNGIGIAEDKQQHIFESFSQADSSTVREYGGTGLGLSISAALVKMLGGELKVDSKIEEGSTFYFSIPITLGKAIDKKSASASGEKIALKGHILIVEDNEANRMFVGIVLRNSGLTYDMAHDGIEAIEKFRTGTYDLILMDENMPKLNGIGATKKILSIEREHGLKHTPIIALTANALVGDRKKFMDAGMDEYVSKPIEPAALLQVLGSFVYA